MKTAATESDDVYPYTDIITWDSANVGTIQARLGRITEEEIAQLQNDGLVVLWRHEDFVFMARQAKTEGDKIQND